MNAWVAMVALLLAIGLSAVTMSTTASGPAPALPHAPAARTASPPPATDFTVAPDGPLQAPTGRETGGFDPVAASQVGASTVPGSSGYGHGDLLTMASGWASGVGVCGDQNDDGAVNVFDAIIDLRILVGLIEATADQERLSDVVRDGQIDVLDVVFALRHILGLAAITGCGIIDTPLMTIVRTSPASGEGRVAVTRETVIDFSGPVNPASVTPESVAARFAGQSLSARRHLSPDGTRLTLFYDSPLPTSARVRVTISGDLLADGVGRAVDADGDGVAGGVAIIDFDTLSLTRIPGTEVRGFVYDSYNKNPDGSDIPVVGATIRVDGFPEANAVTDETGFFVLQDMPAPLFSVHIDGSTAVAPPGKVYATVGKMFHSVAGQSTPLIMDGLPFHIYLPTLDQGDVQQLSPTQETNVVFGLAGKEELRRLFPDMDPEVWDLTTVTFPPNSAVDEQGNPATQAAIIPVPSDRLPAPLPPNVTHQLDIAVMAPGATNFDTPAPACFPNLPSPETGEPLPPGAKSALISFNHDRGEWEMVGPMTVSDDGRLVCTDPGVGIPAPGWHAPNPAGSAEGGEIESGATTTNDKEPGTKHQPPAHPSCNTCGKCSTCQSSESAGDPVYPFSGEFYHVAEDLRIPGRGPDFIWGRKYRSRTGPNTVQGNGWDFYYNIRVAAEGPDLALFDGNSRSDVYQLQPDGSWTLQEFFRRLAQNPDGTHTLTFEDGGQWQFNALDGSPAAGKIASTADRTGNRLGFGYDDQGRLNRITDTLGRDIDIGYNADGFIATVTDFIGRVVRYEYYDGVEPGGSFGDLKSVTTPAVVGTPNGNDFPNGKTTTYTYSTGFTDDRLNHNLLTITDGRRNAPNDPTFGQGPFLVNTYAAATNPEDINFDRAVRQVWGHPTDIIDFIYTPLAPTADNSMAVMQTIVNDRNGNVKEYFYDENNRLVIERQFTGRANPAQPTTRITNRPSGKLHPTDPDFFETRYEWNEDSLQRRVIHPEGNITEYIYEADVNPDAPARSRGNLLREVLIADADRGGDQARIVRSRTYEPIYNQVRTETEPRGNDPAYRPQNGGTNSPGRYTTVYTFDYQESCDFAAIGARVGRSAAQAQQLLSNAGMCAAPLGDVNGDGITDQVNGNVIRVQSPSVNLLAGSNQAAIEGGTLQPIVTLAAYNQFSQLLATTDAEGNVDLYDYYPENDPDGDGLDLTPGIGDGPFGYLKQLTSDVASSPERNSATDPPPTSIRRAYTYDRVGNVIREVDGRGIATDYVVNQLNQIVQVVRAAAHDLFTPDPAEPLPLTDFQYLERFFYDANNNLVRRQVEDRGNTSNVGGNNLVLSAAEGAESGTAFVDYEYEYEILNNLTEMRKEVSDSEVLVNRYRYDPNRNRVLVVQPEGNASASVYDERDLLFESTRGATSPPLLAHLFPGDPTDYDVRGGLSSAIAYHYDSNANLIETVDAADTDGSTANNSRRGGLGDRTRYIYDGFDRRTSTVDAVGNQSVYQYDPAGNVVRESYFGPAGGPSPTADGPDALPTPVSSGGTVQASNLVNRNLLAAREILYDELGRAFQTGRVLFVNTISVVRPPDLADGAVDIGKGNLTPGDNQGIPGIAGINIVGRVTSRTEYDRNSRTTFAVQDDGDTTRAFYDGADRVIRSVDPEGNSVEMAYDDNHNKIEVKETDVSQVAGVPDEVFLTTYFYDSLDRLQRVVDNLGHAMDYRYDSRDNLVAVADAQGPLTGAAIARRSFPAGPLTVDGINDFGNVSRYSYDGISRRLRREVVLTASGQGDGVNIGADLFGIKTATPAPDPTQGGGDGLITLRYQWDRNSLLQGLTDDNGNQTQYAYDNLDRRITETRGICVPPMLADRCDPPTTTTYGYDPDSNLVQFTDENGSVTASQFDGIGRTRVANITPGPGVVGTTALGYEYDGLSRLTRATDNNSPGDPSDDSTITYAYDSLSRVIEETQQMGGLPARAISSSWRAENLRAGLTYPNGRILHYTYDLLDRLNTVADRDGVQPIADYDYIGVGRVAQRRYPINGTRLSYLDDAETADVGYDGIRRPVRLRHLRADNSLVVGFTHTHDRMDNKLTEDKLHDLVNSEVYSYDSAYRLVQFDRPNGGAIRALQSQWDLDGVSNWDQVDGKDRTHSSLNELLSEEGTAFDYDDNGNQTLNGLGGTDGATPLRYEWDHRNLLRKVSRVSDDAVLAEYSYDAAGRRIRKVVTNSAALDGATDFYYHSWQVVEERNSADELVQQYVYGPYFDEPLVLDRNLDGDSGATGSGDQRLFYHQNTVYSVFALTDSVGTIVEGYLYEPYGRQTVFGPGTNGVVDFGEDDVITPAGASTLGNPYLFTGRRLDAETALLYLRHRYMDTLQGRFISRDFVQSVSGTGLYAASFAMHAALDPFGLFEIEWEADFTEAQKQEILDSMARVKERAKSLIDLLQRERFYLEQHLASYPSKECCKPLIERLKHIESLMWGVINHIDSEGLNLEIYEKDLPKGTHAEHYKRKTLWGWDSPVTDNELRIDPEWFNHADRDNTMFHELTHIDDTEDDPMEPYHNNAHQLEALFKSGDFASLGSFTEERRRCLGLDIRGHPWPDPDRIDPATAPPTFPPR